MKEKHGSAQEKLDMESIKDDIYRLREDMKILLTDAGGQSKEKLTEARERVQTAIENLEEKARRQMDHYYSEASDYGREMAEKGRDRIQEQPITSLLIAFGAGILFGKMFSRR